MIWKIADRTLHFEKTLLMGILNLTPDSFSDGGRYPSSQKAICQAFRLEEEGADLLDLGAESTRPQAEPVTAEEELERLLPVLDAIAHKITIPISIDTTKAVVAKECLKRGAQIINDVSGLRDGGHDMATLIKDYQAGLVLMHRRGNPATMQQMAHYQNVTAEVLAELELSVSFAKEIGISEDQWVLDPGLGFAKNENHNLEILRHLRDFTKFGRPILLGPSRKSFIGRFTGREIHERDYGTAAVCAFAVSQGIQILRVHDVRAMKDVIRISEAIQGENYVRTF